ncbi:filamentous hemagglutinin N-terminal domain-containing protein [Haemophilus influenzae]|uniref:two-partner secretion domain-containing protein n=3 Tax=Haemophilus influenzae TaxID=727 RepID=UPI000D01FCA2|nr:filamentous hemagglutinin N-terminal domain-containing protein [Haemophilus influenzae]PRK93604.1 Heme/hemopexin-binding protein precursor [Haemophilus influenzae]
MNKIYRLKFSKRLNALVAVSELTRGCDHSTEKVSEKPVRTKVRHLALKPLSAILLSLGIVSIPQSVLASGLQGMSVVHGTATMQVDGNKTTIRNSVNAIINWKQFNIDQNEMVQFLQENNNSAVFNRVTSDQISQLKGILDSNGQVFLINPNGITIGKDAIINTNGFTASTLDISNENIKARNFTLEQTKDKALAEIVNHGLITVGKDGSVNLIGGKVKNEGVISVNGGSISLLAGQKITISDIINPTITYSIAAPENEAINLGDIFAKGGNINVRAATIRNKGKLSADSVGKDKSGNIVLSAKEGEAEIGGVISAQNQQAKGGKLMITGDKVTLKTGAVIDLSGKEGGETYLGGDERGEGKNGIQLAKKTTLEKGSTINVSGKEKGGRAIVWGDIALIDGNINAQGSGDIAKTGGFVETSGHDLFINDGTTVGAKEWLLDPDKVSIDAPTSGRSDNNPADNEYTGEGTQNSPKLNNQRKPTLTNTTLETILRSNSHVNITAKQEIIVNSSINIGSGSHLTLWSDGNKNGGVNIKKNITSAGGNLTVHSGGWIDVSSNISITNGGNINFKAGKDIAFERGTNQTITGQGVITSGNEKGFRFENVTLNGIGNGLYFNLSRPGSNNGNIINHFNGTLNVSGIVNISMIAPDTNPWYNRHKGRTYWRLSYLNVSQNSKFTLAIDARGRRGGDGGPLASHYNLNGISFTKDTTFNVGRNAKVDFDIKAAVGVIHNKDNLNYALFNGNISVLGGGSVNFALDASSSTIQSPGVIINSNYINVSEGSNLTFKTEGSTKVGFSIRKDLTLNATGGDITFKQAAGTDGLLQDSLVADKNITFEGGNITLKADKKPIKIKGNITVKEGANVTLHSASYDKNKSALSIEGNVTNEGNLTVTGSVININKNLTVGTKATFLANPNYSFNVSGLFNNKGNSNISIARGGAKFKDINNTSSLNITTNSDTTYRTIIEGNITNKAGDLNIIDNKDNAEIQIGGNISQKKGNLTISSDKINITKKITIKAGVDEGGSDSSPASNANLTIKTKTLELTGDLNISGFNKAEITAKNGNDLTIGKASDGNANAKKVTFNQVKDSKISAGSHNVTLNSKVETSNGNNDAESNNGDSTSLTINAKNVTVNNNITSHKTVNITASENVTTKAGTTINATIGSVEVTAKTGDIKGGIESNSGNVNITASGDTLNVSNITGQNVTVAAASGAVTTTKGSTINATTGNANITTKTGEINGEVKSASGNVNITASGNTLNVSNITGQNVTVTANSGAITTTEGSTINATTGDANITTQTGNINGKVESSSGSVTLIATGQTLAVGNISGNTVSVTANSGTLTTKADSTIKGTDSVTTSSQSGDIGGTISGNTVSVSATGDLTTKSGSKIEAKTGEANVTSATGTIGGTVSGDTVNIKATDKLTTQAGSSITSAKGQVDLSAQDSNIEGSINAANVTLNTTGTLTTAKSSKINATSGTLVINAKDADLNGEASGNHTVVNATNANGSGSVIATTSSRVNITGDLITINGLNIISKNGKNTVLLKGVEIDVKYIQPGIASVNEVIEAKRALEKVKDLSDEERETLAKLGVSAVRFIEPNNTITVNTQNEFTTRPLSRIVISEGRACFSNSDGATVCVNIADNGR